MAVTIQQLFSILILVVGTCMHGCGGSDSTGEGKSSLPGTPPSNIIDTDEGSETGDNTQEGAGPGAVTETVPAVHTIQVLENGNIVVSISNHGLFGDSDWIGIYMSDHIPVDDYDSSNDSRVWKYLSEINSDGTIELTQHDAQGYVTFPLVPGKYLVYLLKNDAYEWYGSPTELIIQ